ncbi:DUF2141 domain-containing protein [Hymenobacter oligotrophus]|uniref:DUF2141 domain-containing protein n=1 Tax=Hymenobacter oligotrophus TaxID=2319843 RepID=UPI0013C2BA80|nr:DUF2141 domain-containing protein [Hymenobacter oligotrophus]
MLLLAAAAFRPAAQQAPLQLQIRNAQPARGRIVVELYRTEAEWLQTPFRRISLPADGAASQATLAVPYGKYAVSIYQDANGNGRLDQNFLGIPKEPIGFGNNYKPFGKPDFAPAVIEHGPTIKPAAIKLFSVL